MNTKRILLLLAGLLLIAPVLAWAQAPDPMDSVILESKTVSPSLSGPAIFTQKVYITNRDTVAILTLALKEVSSSGGAYADLDSNGNDDGWTLADCLSYLKTTLDNNPAEDFAQYNGSSPDYFLVASTFSPTGTNPVRDAEPINLTRSAIWEFKYMSSDAPLGTVDVDTSGLLAQKTGFTILRDHGQFVADVPVNFVKGVITVSQPPVGNPPPGNTVNAGSDNCARYNFDAASPCSDNFTLAPGSPGSIGTDGQFLLCDQCGGDYPVTIIEHCGQNDIPYTFTAHFNPGPPTAVCPPSAQVQAGSPYNGNATAISGVPPYTFSGDASNPAGLVVSATGAISWTPTVADVGSHTVIVHVVDNCQQTAECSFTIRVVVGGPFRICIDKLGPRGVYQGTDVEVSIRNVDDATDPLLANGKDVGGFSFLLSYDCSCLQFLSARKGAFLVSHRWEFFTYRYGAIGNGNCGAGCPSCLIRVVAIADVNNGASHPLYDHTNQGEWVVLKFRTSNDRTLAGQCCAISWFWYDCTDNTVSDSTGNVLYVVDSLYSASGALVDLATSFPNNVANCDAFSGGPGKPTPKKNIIFCNGQICLPTPEEIDDRGDLNLNGLKNEIADAVLYENYFIYGPGVLSPDPQRRQGQIAASDINGDGLVLSVADLVSLIRIITGDENPLPRMNPAEGAVSITLSSAGPALTLSANSASDLGGLYLKFKVSGTVGTLALAKAAEGMTMKTNLDGNVLSVLIYSETKGQRIEANAGALFSMAVAGSAELIESGAADYYGIALPTLTKVAALPTSFGLSQNYPNPFNGRTSFVLALPVASDYRVTVYNVAGQVVRTFEGSAPAGNRTITWDGTDRNGTAVSSGVYFYKAVAGNYSATLKMLYLK